MSALQFCGSTHLRLSVLHPLELLAGEESPFLTITSPLMVIMTVLCVSRATLRMLEGLQSHDTAVRHLTESWVVCVLQRGEVDALVEPLVRITLKAQLKRSREDVAAPKVREDLIHNPEYAKYYYSSLGVPHPSEVKVDQYHEITLSYSQVFDSDQALYALSLLRSVLAVDPSSAVVEMAEAVINVASYAAVMDVPSSSSSSSSSSKPGDVGAVMSESSTEAPSHMCLLQLVVSACADYLRSEYPVSLEATQTEYADSLKVKVVVCELLRAVLCQFVAIVSQLQAHSSIDGVHTPEGTFGAISNASFVSALVTLCDLQKIALLVLGQTVLQLREATSDPCDLCGESPDSEATQERCATSEHPKAILQSLFVHLLHLVQSLIALDAQCSIGVSTPKPTTPLTRPASSSSSSLKTSLDLPPVIADVLTAAQPFFHGLLLLILEDTSLLALHGVVLSMLTSSLPFLGCVLDDLAPKILKQLCSNLDKTHPQTESLVEKSPQSSEASLSSGKTVVCYLEALVAIALWCLFGKSLKELDSGNKPLRLHHHQLNLFWRTPDVKEAKEISESLSPTSKQPSPMSWLLGVFSTNAGHTSSVKPAPPMELAIPGKSPLPPSSSSSSSRAGVHSRVGQYVLMLLPAVYNATTEVWSRFNTAAPQVKTRTDSTAEKMKRAEFQVGVV